MTTRILIGDCIEQMRGLPDGSVDAVVTDPPAGIAFMGKEWDRNKGGRDSWIAWMQGVADECLRLLKPGGHALVWALPRTSHWTATAWENAGFEVRDRVSHVFASGFPKSLSVGKAVDKLQGNERERVGTQITNVGMQGNNFKNKSQSGEVTITKGTSEWEGWHTALKPSMEDWWLLRKPLTGTVAENVLKHGCGALNIDGCRIGTDEKMSYSKSTVLGAPCFGTGTSEQNPQGRWPANFCHDGSEEVVGLFPNSSVTGDRTKASRAAKVSGTTWGTDNHESQEYTDTGSAARFFFCAKASKYDRDHGLEGTAEHLCGMMEDDEYPIKTGSGNLRETKRHNHHPTVKPHNLMRWLCRLVTPPGGTIMDPFMGSGSTGKAAIREGFSFIGIELDPEYAEIARKRIEAVKYAPKAKVLPRYQEKDEVRRKPEQLELFQMEAN